MGKNSKFDDMKKLIKLNLPITSLKPYEDTDNGTQLFMLKLLWGDEFIEGKLDVDAD